MLRLGAALIAAVLLTAQAPIHTVPSQPHRAVNQQAAQDKARGTEEAPLFVKVEAPERSAAEIASEQEREQEALKIETRLADLTGDLATYTRKLYVATAALALITLGLLVLGFMQAFDNKRSIKAAEIAAKAAQASAEATQQQLKPFISVKNVALHNYGLGQAPWALIVLKNSGGGPAFNVTQRARMGVDHFPLPGLPPDEGPPEFRDSIPLAANGEIQMHVALARELQVHHIAAFNADAMAIYVSGDVSYIDMFKERHTIPIILFSNNAGGMQHGQMAAYSINTEVPAGDAVEAGPD